MQHQHPIVNREADMHLGRAGVRFSF